MTQKTFQALIDQIEQEAFTFSEHNKKLRDYIMRIFFIDDPIIDPPDPTDIAAHNIVETRFIASPDPANPAPPPNEFETVETKFKKAIQKLDKQNQEYAKLLQIIADWIK